MSTEHVMVEDLQIIHETEKAIGVWHDYLDEGEVVWIPLSQIESIHREGNLAKIYMTAWIAKEKDLV